MLKLEAQEKLYARLKKQLATLVPEQTALTAAEEKVKRGIKPHPNYVPILIGKIKEFYCEYFGIEQNQPKKLSQKESNRLRNKISAAEARLNVRLKEMRDEVESL